MWFVLPQLRGLGTSERATYYGIKNAKEAREYLADDELRTRLEKILKIVLTIESSDPVAIFGQVDAEKFHASVTLFAQVVETPDLYQQVLVKYFNGDLHRPTLDLLNK
jgi:uncharacterized protein (DUF1810 family)